MRRSGVAVLALATGIVALFAVQIAVTKIWSPVSTRMVPDNVHWDVNGKLVIADAYTAGANSCGEPLCFEGWAVIEVDPETLTISSLASSSETNSMQRASAAIRVGNEIWASGPDRIARIPQN